MSIDTDYQWLDCNNGNATISGATNATYTPTANGDYAVAITLNGCTKISDCVNVVLSSVKETNSTTNVIRIYPNPAQAKITIDTNGDIEEFKILDSKGQLVQTSQNVQKTIDISELNSGMYLIQVQTQQSVQTARFVKK